MIPQSPHTRLWRAATAARLSIPRRCAAQLLRHAVLSALPLQFALAQAAEPTLPEDEVVLPAVTVTESATSAVEALGATDLQAPSGTASRLGLSLRETPAAAYIADRAMIDARGASNTQEMLAGIPGVTAHSAPGNPTVSFRGFSGGAVSQLFNGINTQYSIAARPVDSWIYDRVEAIGGASSFLYGAGGVGGTLNYITKLAEPTDFSEGQVRLGSHGAKQVSVGINRRLGDASDATATNAHYLRLDVNHSRGGSAVDGVKSAASQLAASLRSDLGGGLRHTLAYEVQHERVDRPYWGTPLRNPLVGEAQIDPATHHKNYNSADGLYAQNVQWLRSITEWQVDEHLRWSNTFYAYSAQRDYRNVESYRFNADNSAVIRASALLQRHKQHLVGNRVEGQLQSTLGGQRSDWAWGLDVSVNRQTRYPNSLGGTISTVNPYDFVTEDFFSIPGMQPGFHADRNNRITNVALYAENRTYLAPALQLISALRHERIDLDLTNQRAIAATQPASYARNYQPTTGRLGLVWEATPDVALYAQLATAADPPAGALASLSFADALNGTELTTGRQVEVGSKWQGWDGKASATLAAYHIERKNIATQDPSNPSRTVLVGQQSARGLEATAGVSLSPRLALRGDASWVRARYDNFQQGGVSLAGNRPTNTPAVVGNLWAFYQVSPQLQLSAGVRHIGKIYGDAANTLYWPSTTLLDLGLDYRIDRHTSLQARLRNATDRTYAASLSSGMAYLGAARSASLALRMGF